MRNMSANHPQPGDLVIVFANHSEYKGTLVGMTENEIYLKSPTRSWTIPMSQVQGLRVVNKASK